MSNNSVMLMAKFIFSHPEYQMRTPREWKIHFEDEFGEENTIYSFSPLKQYPSLVRIERNGRNSLYGSAKLSGSIPLNQNTAKSSLVKGNQSRQKAKKKGNQQVLNFKKTVKKLDKQESEANLSPQLALEKISQIMTEASRAIEEVVRQTELD